MTLCECGCGQEAKEGNRFLIGHNRKNKKLSKETRQKMSLSQMGNQNGLGYRHTEEAKEKISQRMLGHQNALGYRHTEETRLKISQSHTGKHLSEEHKQRISQSLIIHGRDFILNRHYEYKKQECIFGCNSNYYVLHHEPAFDDLLEWEGHLINICRGCHKRVHNGSLKLPDNAGIKWTLEDTADALDNEETDRQ